MTNKSIEKLLKMLNNKKYEDTIYLKTLSQNVDFGFVWLKKPKMGLLETISQYSYKMYFIKNEEEYYIGAVLDMTKDLHWVIDKKFRGKGYLSNALTNTILPHLFLDRKEQRITISEGQIGKENALKSENVAKKVGFEFIQETKEHQIGFYSEIKEFVLKKRKSNKFIPIQNAHVMSEERLKILVDRLDYLTASINMIKYEFEAAYGSSHKLSMIVKSLNSHKFRLEDIWWDNRK